jgi:hypothetical protein
VSSDLLLGEVTVLEFDARSTKTDAATGSVGMALIAFDRLLLVDSRIPRPSIRRATSSIAHPPAGR